jgi:hypothetical protein
MRTDALLAVGTEGLPVEDEVRVEAPGAPAAEHLAHGRFGHAQEIRQRREVLRETDHLAHVEVSFGHPSRRRPIPGNSESSTVE